MVAVTRGGHASAVGAPPRSASRWCTHPYLVDAAAHQSHTHLDNDLTSTCAPSMPVACEGPDATVACAGAGSAVALGLPVAAARAPGETSGALSESALPAHCQPRTARAPAVSPRFALPSLRRGAWNGGRRVV